MELPRNSTESIGQKLSEQIAGLSEVEQLKQLIILRYGSISAWAREHGWWPEHVHMTLAGTRPGEEVRQAIAADFEIDRVEVDQIIPIRTPAALRSAS